LKAPRVNAVKAPWLSAGAARAGEKSIFTLQLTIGCAVAMAGFCWYSHCKLFERLSSQAAAAKDAATLGAPPPAKAAGLASPAPSSSGHAAAAGLRGRTQSTALGDEEAPGGDLEAGEHRPLLGGGGSGGARGGDLAGAAHLKHSIAGGRMVGGSGYADSAYGGGGGYAGLLKAGLPGGVFRADVRANAREQEV